MYIYDGEKLKPYLNKLLETGIFAPWPLHLNDGSFELDTWIRVKGTSLFYNTYPKAEINKKWYHLPTWKEHLRGNFPTEALVVANINELDEVNLERLNPYMEGKGYLDIITPELIELLPEELQVKMLFNIDLFR